MLALTHLLLIGLLSTSQQPNQGPLREVVPDIVLLVAGGTSSTEIKAQKDRKLLLELAQKRGFDISGKTPIVLIDPALVVSGPVRAAGALLHLKSRNPDKTAYSLEDLTGQERQDVATVLRGSSQYTSSEGATLAERALANPQMVFGLTHSLNTSLTVGGKTVNFSTPMVEGMGAKDRFQKLLTPGLKRRVDPDDPEEKRARKAYADVEAERAKRSGDGIAILTLSVFETPRTGHVMRS